MYFSRWSMSMNYISSKFLNPEEPDEAKKVCVFGLKANEFEILK